MFFVTPKNIPASVDETAGALHLFGGHEITNSVQMVLWCVGWGYCCAVEIGLKFQTHLGGYINGQEKKIRKHVVDFLLHLQTCSRVVGAFSVRILTIRLCLPRSAFM